MKRIVILAVLVGAFMVSGCSSSKDAERALTNAGYTNIQAGGHGWFACGEDDFFSTKFTATNPSGSPVSGVVCSGLFFKNATIRF